MNSDQIEALAEAIALASGVSKWEKVSEEGEYDSRAYWRRLARRAAAFHLTDAELRAAWLRTDGEVGDPVADAIAAEMAKREIDV